MRFMPIISSFVLTKFEFECALSSFLKHVTRLLPSDVEASEDPRWRPAPREAQFDRGMSDLLRLDIHEHCSQPVLQLQWRGKCHVEKAILKCYFQAFKTCRIWPLNNMTNSTPPSSNPQTLHVTHLWNSIWGFKNVTSLNFITEKCIGGKTCLL